jgi:cobalt/nickel transport system ATP-binding protein
MDPLMPVKHPPLQIFEFPEDVEEILQIIDLHFVYPGGFEALKGVSIKIKQGEKVGLVGPNGAGKSTLMLHLNGILRGNGAVSVAGLSMIEKNLPVIRAIVGLVFQNPDDQLFSPTVFDDVAFGPLHMGFPEEVVYNRVESALDAVQMGGFEERLSHHLSMGQKKRIAIATVLSMDPKILVLDEPSAGLDPRARRSLIQLLDEMSITMLVSTHDLRMVKELFTRMIVMDEGKIIADGNTLELMNDEALLEAHGLEKP